MKFQKQLSLSSSFVTLMLLAGCGGGGGSESAVSTDTTSNTSTAVLIDGIVTGARYDAGEGITGITDEDGVFRYVEGKPVKFYVDNIFIGEGYPVDKPANVVAKRDKIITPFELAGVPINDVNNSDVLKVVRFLMAVDSDYNASNGMDVEGSAVADGASLPLLDDNTLLESLIDPGVLPTETEAYEHLCTSLQLGCNAQNELPNNPPKIYGTPKTESAVYAPYQFLPSASDENNDTLTFSIANKPEWAEFNSTTGVLSGTPIAEGNFTDIRISVSDGKEQVALDPFSIEVKPALDIAHAFGTATQGTDSSYAYYLPAANAIDADNETYNHTDGGATGKNWLQIELPDPTVIHQVIVQGRADWVSRLTNAKVYILDTPYETGDNLDSVTPIYTLAATADVQIITPTAPISGKYLLIKGEQRAEDDRHLHLRRVEVYGETPPAPVFKPYEESYQLPYGSEEGTKIETIEAIDYQSDTIHYSVDNTLFSIDVDGTLRVNGTLASGEYNVTVTASDGVNSTSTVVPVVVTSSDAVEIALKSGKVDGVTDLELIEAALTQIGIIREGGGLYDALYQGNAIAYEPGQSTQLINYSGDMSTAYPILFGTGKKTLALAGTKKKSRFAVFGSTPMQFFVNGEQTGYETAMKRLLYWLLGGLPIDEQIANEEKRVVIASDSSDTQKWLAESFTNWNVSFCTTDATIASCAAGADLLVMDSKSNRTDIVESIDGLLDNGTPILFLYDGWSKDATTDEVAALFDFSFPYGGNWWALDKADWTDLAAMKDAINSELNLEPIETMLTHLKQKNYAFDWSQCKNSNGEYGENNSDCSEVPNLSSDFEEGTSYLRTKIKGIDEAKKPIFDTEGTYRFEKLLILIGDKFRGGVHYPMDKVTTDDTLFVQSFYADSAVFNFRKINPVQPDMGNFSRSDFSSVTPVDKTVRLVSKDPFRATGLYALPGQTIKVTRQDNDSQKVWLFINTLRDGATHQYEQNGYKRPKYLRSAYWLLEKDKPIEITSPYGGPIEIWFDENDKNITVAFEHVGEHPVWSEYDNDPDKDSKFAEALDANQYDWAEIITSAFEVHSTVEKMKQSIANQRWQTASKLAEATKFYASSYPMSLAGYKGPGIEVIDEVKQFADDNGIPIYEADFVKHMNADQAACGYGCSGNPYDAYWAFDPISHGDVHEIGHSLERANFRLEGWEVHSSTNYYAYYTQERYNQYVESESSITDKSSYYITNSHVPVSVFKWVYEKLQGAVNESDPQAWLKINLWDQSDWSSQSLFMIQAMMMSQKYSTGKYALTDGMHLLARLHVLDRHLAYVKNDTDWDANKAKLGFDTYTLDEIQSITSNDWLVISLSYAAGLDFRSFFDMYGEPYSTKASDQIERFGFLPTKKVFFAEETNSGFIMPDDGSGAYLNKTELPVDGNTTYPY